MATIDKDKFPSNSYKSRQSDISEEPEIHVPEPIIEEGVSLKRKGIFGKMKDSLIGGDLRDVGEFVVDDIIVPTLKDNLLDIVSRGFEMFLYGDSSGRRQTRSIGSRSASKYYTSYDSYYSGGSRREASRGSERRYNDEISLDEDIFLEDQEDRDGRIISGFVRAKLKLTQAQDIFDEYGKLTVQDMYDLVGVTTPWTYKDYGWTSMSGFDVRRVRGGGLIILPKAKQL